MVLQYFIITDQVIAIFFRFEDGTLPYLDIISLNHAFSVYEQLTGCMSAVLNHTHSIALYTYNNMSAMKHLSGKPLCKLYCKTDFKNKAKQGPIINFNLLRANGDFVGYSEVSAGIVNGSHLYTFLSNALQEKCLQK